MVDEIKEVKQDSPPEGGQASKDKAEITSQKTPETFDKKQVETAISDALSKAGRTAKELELQRGEANRILEDAKRERVELAGAKAEVQREGFERQRETHRDDPDAIKAIDARQKIAEEKAELAKRKLELDERDAKSKPQLEEIAESKKERNALEIALKHNVAYEVLLKHTDGSLEAMEDLAKQLPRKGDVSTLKPDSNKTDGGGELDAEQRLKARYPSM